MLFFYFIVSAELLLSLLWGTSFSAKVSPKALSCPRCCVRCTMASWNEIIWLISWGQKETVWTNLLISFISFRLVSSHSRRACVSAAICRRLAVRHDQPPPRQEIHNADGAWLPRLQQLRQRRQDMGQFRALCMRVNGFVNQFVCLFLEIKYSDCYFSHNPLSCICVLHWPNH
jgi:hypothetical protein